MMRITVTAVTALTAPPSPVSLRFEALAAGFGEHLFNNIAREIISA